MTKTIAAAATFALALSVVPFTAAGHDDEHFAAGQPGNPKQPARVVKVTMLEDGKKMLFEPAHITVRRGEQVRFDLYNEGTESHEFVLATVAENRKHAEVMKKHPHMEHDDPNALRLTPYSEGKLLWKFTKKGRFEFACLIPGHLEAGMHGTIDVQ